MWKKPIFSDKKLIHPFNKQTEMKLYAILIISLLAVTGLSSQTDAIERFFKDYQENENFSVVYVSPKMFKMVSKTTNEQNNQEVASILQDLKGLRILTTKVNPEKIYREANQRLNVKEYEELMTVREKNSNIKFITKESNNVINELLLLVGSSEEFLMLSFVGTIDLAKISKLAKSLDIQGAEHLDKIEKKKK
jgi:vacuolar-type H+-ATPase subunit F/Vma7